MEEFRWGCRVRTTWPEDWQAYAAQANREIMILPLLEEHHYGEAVNVRRRYGLPALRASPKSRSPGWSRPTAS